MGVMLEPELWFAGGFGSSQNMKLGFGLRPYFNISIEEEGATGGLAVEDTSETQELVIYPFRCSGLPRGKNYMLQVTSNGMTKNSTMQMSTGVIEYIADAENFSFGVISENRFLDSPIEVSILEEGKTAPVATGSAKCKSLVNGVCSPSPTTVIMKVDGKTVAVELSIIWQANPLNLLKSKIKDIIISWPAFSVTPAITAKLNSPSALASAELVLNLNGRSLNCPLLAKGNSTSMLRSNTVYEMGPSYMDVWTSTGANSADSTIPTATLDLVISGNVIASGTLPPISWDQASTISKNWASTFNVAVQQIPVMVPLWDNEDKGKQLAMGEVSLNVLPATNAALWIVPYEASNFVQGTTYTFSWTKHGGSKPGVEEDFVMHTMQVSNDGVLTPTEFQKSLKLSCTDSSTGALPAYVGGVTPCVFETSFTVPSKLVGKKIVLKVTWIGKKGHTHILISPPIQFVSSGRRLKNVNADQWGVTSKGSTTSNTFGPKVKQKLQKLAAHCNAAPLKYGIGAGMNFVQHMRNIILPMAMPMMGGMSEAPKFDSKPQPIFRLGTGEGGTELSKILPKSLCAGGVCEGMMPGCRKTKVNPISIPQIVVKLSRRFKWKEHVGPKMRRAIAYGLALLPSAIDVGERQVKANLNSPEPDERKLIVVITTPPPTAPPSTSTLPVTTSTLPATTTTFTWTSTSTTAPPTTTLTTTIASTSTTAAPATTTAAPATTSTTRETTKVTTVRVEEATTATTAATVATPSEALSSTSSAEAAWVGDKAASRSPLPEGWQELHSAEGKAYYYNAASGATQWQRPTPVVSAPTSAPRPAPVPRSAELTAGAAGAEESAGANAAASSAVGDSSADPTGRLSNDNQPFEVVQPYFNDLAKRDPYYDDLVHRRLVEEEEEEDDADWEEKEPWEAEPVDDDELEDLTEYDTFKMRITKPIHYNIDKDLFQSLIDRGAFRIKDGREDTHGPIFIQDFELIDPPHSQAKAASGSHSNDVPPPPPQEKAPAAAGADTEERGHEATVGGAAHAAVAVDDAAKGDAPAAPASGHDGRTERPPFIARVPPEEVLGMAAGGVLGAAVLAIAVSGASRLRRTHYSAVAATDLQEHHHRDFA